MSRQLEIPIVVARLIGRIEPAGDSSRDFEHLDNLKEMISLTENLIDKIVSVSKHKDSYEHSVSMIGKKADEFITNLKEAMNE